MANLYHFQAYLKLVYQEHQPAMIDLDLKQFVPRGSHVRNSNCIYMMVLYTGLETKLILNQGSYRFKQSHVDKMINVVLSCNLVAMLMFTIILTLLNYRWNS